MGKTVGPKEAELRRQREAQAGAGALPHERGRRVTYPITYEPVTTKCGPLPGDIVMTPEIVARDVSGKRDFITRDKNVILASALATQDSKGRIKVAIPLSGDMAVPSEVAVEPKPKRNRNDYQRDLMRKRRADAKAAKAK